MNPMITPSPTVPLEVRADSQSSSSSGSRTSSSSTPKCTSKDGSCEKPVSETGLTIGLAVGIPVALVVLILGYFLIRNYRKEKKEMLEHDPDFDETGEATALPDLPQKRYEVDDPFSNRHSIRYPGGPIHGKGGSFVAASQHLNSSASLALSHHDPYMDTVVLPYQQQIGSKASLDEYARTVSGFPAYGRENHASSTRSSTFINHSRSGSNLDFYNSNNSTSNTKINETSPMKNRKFVDLSREKSTSEDQYTSIPNESFASVELYSAKENQTTSDLESVSNSSGRSSEETERGANDTISNGNNHMEGFESYNTTVSTDNTVPLEDDTYNTTAPSTRFSRRNTQESKQSTIEGDDKAKSGAIVTALSELGQSSSSKASNGHEHNNAESYKNAPITDKSFAKSPETSRQDLYEGCHPPSPSQEYRDSVVTNGSIPSPDIDKNIPSSPFDDSNSTAKDKEQRRYSPRISAFNLLKNDSDEEIEEKEGGPEMTDDQKEELNRMKSVYKVYFDRENSVKVPNKKFEHDPSKPMPEYAHEQFLKLNNHLKGDTNYDKRLTTTSSIYTENQVFSPEEQYYYQQQQQFANQPPPVQYNNENQPSDQLLGPPAPELTPLQVLPPASDIRKSTIQTYTDFQPKHKGSSIPQGKQPFVPIENESVWSSPVLSPNGQSQSQFDAFHNSNGAPVKPGMSSTPSASQLARSSVVMLNPVTEITKQRKFKPAGSITPTGTRLAAPYNQHNMNLNSQGELIPDSKEDLRRMMNSNI